MVQFLQRSPSFGEQLASGIGQGLSKAVDFTSQMGMEKFKQSQRKKLIEDVERGSAPQNFADQNQPQKEDLRQKFLDSLPELENLKQQTMGEDLTPQDLDEIWEHVNKVAQQPMQQTQQQAQDPASAARMRQKKYAMLGEHELARVAGDEAKSFEKKSGEEKKLAFDETKDFRKHVTQQSRSATELEPVLGQMERLIKQGKLTNPVIAKLADKFGLVGLLDPTSQQFQALAVGFLRDAKNIFGSRVTNLDLQTYIDKIPRLAQTDEGKKALIDNFRTLGEAAKIRDKTKNEIIKQNKGIPPMDLEEQVTERSAPKIDKLSEKFNRSFYETSRGASGKIRMRHPINGILGEVSEDRVQDALQKGYVLE